MLVLLSIRVAEPWTAVGIAFLILALAGLVALTVWLIHRA